MGACCWQWCVNTDGSLTILPSKVWAHCHTFLTLPLELRNRHQGLSAKRLRAADAMDATRALLDELMGGVLCGACKPALPAACTAPELLAMHLQAHMHLMLHMA